MTLYICGRIAKDIDSYNHTYKKDDWVLCSVLLGTDNTYEVIAIHDGSGFVSNNEVSVDLCKRCLSFNASLDHVETFTNNDTIQYILEEFKDDIYAFHKMHNEEIKETHKTIGIPDPPYIIDTGGTSTPISDPYHVEVLYDSLNNDPDRYKLHKGFDELD